jgi:hypothetical protein
LLFDETDRLFGKRGDVKHGRGRNANLEVFHSGESGCVRS